MRKSVKNAAQFMERMENIGRTSMTQFVKFVSCLEKNWICELVDTMYVCVHLKYNIYIYIYMIWYIIIFIINTYRFWFLHNFQTFHHRYGRNFVRKNQLCCQKGECKDGCTDDGRECIEGCICSLNRSSGTDIYCLHENHEKINQMVLM